MNVNRVARDSSSRLGKIADCTFSMILPTTLSLVIGLLASACSNDMGDKKIRSRVLLIFDEINLTVDGRYPRSGQGTGTSVQKFKYIALESLEDVFSDLEMAKKPTTGVPYVKATLQMNKSGIFLSEDSTYTSTVTLECFDSSGVSIRTIRDFKEQTNSTLGGAMRWAMRDVVRKLTEWPQIQSLARGSSG